MELSESFLEEIALDARSYWRFVMVRSVIYVLGIGNVAYGVFAASFAASLELCNGGSSSCPQSNYSLVGLIVVNVFTSAFVIADFYWNYRNRRLQRMIPVQSQTTYFIIFVPLSTFLIVGLILSGINNQFLDIAMDASTISMRLLSLIFVAVARHSYDNGEKMPQTMLRFITIIFSITSLANLCLYDLGIFQAHVFIKILVYDVITNTFKGTLEAVTVQYQFYTNKIMFAASAVGILLLLDPLTIQWNLIRKRLSYVKMLDLDLDQIGNISPNSTARRFSTVLHWLCSLAICGSLLGASILMLIGPFGREPYLIAACVAYAVAILVTIYHLIRLQHSTTPHHNLLPNNISYQWLNVDILLTCVGTFGFILKIIANFVLVTNCINNPLFILFIAHRCVELFQGIFQTILLMVMSDRDPNMWKIPSKILVDRLWQPIHFLVSLNITCCVTDIINFVGFTRDGFNHCNFFYLSTGALYYSASSGAVLYRIASVYLMIKYITLEHKMSF